MTGTLLTPNETPAQIINKLVIVGTGLMGSGIAQVIFNN